MKNELVKTLKGVRWLKADAHSNSPGTVTGAAVDCLGFGEAMPVLDVSDVGSPAGSITLKFQESDTGVASPDSFSDITGATFGALTTNGVRVGRINLEARKRYLRAVATIGTGPVDASCSGPLLPNREVPVSQENSVVFNV